MRDLAFFRHDIWDLNWKQGRDTGTERDTGFQFLFDLINCYWPAQEPQASRNEQRICTVSGSVKRIHYRLTTLVSRDCRRSLSPIPTDCNHLCWPLTSMASVQFQHFRRLGFPERLVCLGQHGHTGWRWSWFYRIKYALPYYEKDVQGGMASFRVRKQS